MGQKVSIGVQWEIRLEKLSRAKLWRALSKDPYIYYSVLQFNRPSNTDLI